MTITAPLQATFRAGRWLALGAVAGPVAFTLAWLVLGALSSGYTLFGRRFTDYSPISQPISGLGMGATAPYMNAAFVVTGLALAAGVIGVFRTLPPDRPTLRRWSAALLACTGVGQALCGIFDLEAMAPHSLGFALAVATPIVAFPAAGRWFRDLAGWRRFGTWLRLGGPLTLVLLVAFFATFQPTADGAEHGVAGLVQRLLVLEVHAWFVAMGWLAYRRGGAESIGIAGRR
ncbi:DUF998 domain-containing protein [Micromonospora sp. B11E3]|uniref:DUF998 domain-containing protein n=1 Tax=Micromonospora sp. B11E3 TaxID=3153562 RepID=UPI00325CB098